MWSDDVSSDAPTHVVELTPVGRGAIAVVLVDGARATHAVGKYFAAASGRPIAETPIGRIVFGRWGGAGGEELIACRRAEDQIEVHCHGGTAAVDRIVRDLVEGGCCRISWQEWVKLASRRDATTIAAEIALADAPTERTAAILLDQLHGALSKAIGEAISAITGGDLSRALLIIDELLTRRDVGRHLISPWRVVLAGAPNVGKSSLINALAGFQRAIVSPQPGTTRDVVTVSTAIDGWPVQLIDTAGLRESEDELEAAGVVLANAAMARADLVLVVHDAARLAGGGDGVACEISPRLVSGVRVIHVVNKIDLVQPEEQSRIRIPKVANQVTALDLQFVSALTGERVAELVAAIGHILVSEIPPPGAAVPFSDEQVKALVSAREQIERQNADAASTALRAALVRAAQRED
jgi:tRNA modification GTPase